MAVLCGGDRAHGGLDSGLPEGANLSVMVFLPKASPPAEVAQYVHLRVGATQPSTLSDTLPKMYLLGLSDRLSALASLTVVGQQRGVVPARQLAGNVYEAESAMTWISAIRRRCCHLLRLRGLTLHVWVGVPIMEETQHLRSRHLRDAVVGDASGCPRAQPALTARFRSRLPLAAGHSLGRG